MEEQKKGVEDIREKIAKEFVIPELDVSLVSKKIVEDQLAVHQKAYLGAIVMAKTELKFLTDSIDFVENTDKEDPNAVATATKHLARSKTNPKYFETIQVDPSCRRVLGNLQNIEAKMTEVKNQLWAIEYHSKKIVEVKGYLSLFE